MQFLWFLLGPPFTFLRNNNFKLINMINDDALRSFINMINDDARDHVQRSTQQIHLTTCPSCSSFWVGRLDFNINDCGHPFKSFLISLCFEYFCSPVD